MWNHFLNLEHFCVSSFAYDCADIPVVIVEAFAPSLNEGVKFCFIVLTIAAYFPFEPYLKVLTDGHWFFSLGFFINEIVIPVYLFPTALASHYYNLK